jgi:hypothetical protein
LHKTYHVNETRKMKMTADNVMTQPTKRQPTKVWRIRNEKTKENRQNNSIDSLARNSKEIPSRCWLLGCVSAPIFRI